MVRGIGQSIDPTTAVVIFPEGRLFRPDRLERASGAARHSRTPNEPSRLAPLQHVLPPRPGGVLALINTVPADVVVIAHARTRPVRIVRRTRQSRPAPQPHPRHRLADPADQIPNDDGQRIDWLDEQWLHVDEWIDRYADGPHRSDDRASDGNLPASAN